MRRDIRQVLGRYLSWVVRGQFVLVVFSGEILICLEGLRFGKRFVVDDLLDGNVFTRDGVIVLVEGVFWFVEDADSAFLDSLDGEIRGEKYIHFLFDSLVERLNLAVGDFHHLEKVVIPADLDSGLFPQKDKGSDCQLFEIALH